MMILKGFKTFLNDGTKSVFMLLKTFINDVTLKKFLNDVTKKGSFMMILKKLHDNGIKAVLRKFRSNDTEKFQKVT